MELPTAVEKRLHHLGDPGVEWRTRLPDTLSRLQTLWSISLGVVLHGGSEALVIEAGNEQGDKLVMKLLLPSIVEPGQSEVLVNRERSVLEAAKGRGYVALIESDELTGAMLLPRLGSPLGKTETDPETRQRLLCETLKLAWQTPTSGLDLQTGADKALWLRSLISKLAEKHSAFVSTQTLSTALEFIHRRQRAHKLASKVLVHGDPHGLNALRGSQGDYVLIDPDGLYAEPEYDLGVLMREENDGLLELDTAPIARGKSVCERLALLTGTQPRAIWQWGFIELVSTGLYTLELDMPEYGKPALQVANSWATQGALHCYDAH